VIHTSVHSVAAKIRQESNVRGVSPPPQVFGRGTIAPV